MEQIAVDVSDGALKWGFQYTPHDTWDYDGNNAPILVDLGLEGEPVKALIQSNRNGFFYVLDATTREFIYAVATIEGINWTSGLDPETGRPTVNEEMVPHAGADPVEPIVPGL